jgi:UDP-N-acetyl-D-glucosamine dehydrogenase
MSIGIVGMGYVGLPLAVGFAEAGLDVIGVDVDQAKVTSSSCTRPRRSSCASRLR